MCNEPDALAPPSAMPVGTGWGAARERRASPRPTGPAAPSVGVAAAYLTIASRCLRPCLASRLPRTLSLRSPSPALRLCLSLPACLRIACLLFLRRFACASPLFCILSFFSLRITLRACLRLIPVVPPGPPPAVPVVVCGGLVCCCLARAACTCIGMRWARGRYGGLFL